MKKKHYIALILVALVIGLGAHTLWQDKERESAGGNASSKLLPPAPSLIDTSRPALMTFTRQIPWIGTVESQTTVELTALTAGRVAAIDAEDQRYVEKGQVVLRLGGAQIDDARASLKAKISSLGRQLDLAGEILVRLEENLKTRLATKDQVAAAQEVQVRLAEQLRDAQLNLKTLDNHSNVTAPIGGVFTNRRVSPGQDVVAGQVVGDIIDMQRLRIAAALFPPQGIDLPGKAAAIRLDANQNVTGVVTKVLPRASSTGAVLVWLEGPQINARLHPGETVGGHVMAESRSGALAVPASAIVYDNREHPLLFVRKNSTYERVAIQTGMAQDGWVEVLSGVKRDQLVVVKGAYELFYRDFNEQFKVQD